MSKRLFLFLLAIILAVPLAFGDEDGVRKARKQPSPTYPQIARKLRLAGTVKLELSVAPDGHVKNAKVLGGHPVLANSALDAVRHWQYDPAPQETVQTVNVRFEP